jgi:hypothetical protein
VLDANFVFLRVSQGYAEAIGRPPAFFPGRNYFALFPHAASEAVFRQVRDSGTAQAACGAARPPAARTRRRSRSLALVADPFRQRRESWQQRAIWC